MNKIFMCPLMKLNEDHLPSGYVCRGYAIIYLLAPAALWLVSVVVSTKVRLGKLFLNAVRIKSGNDRTDFIIVRKGN